MSYYVDCGNPVALAILNRGAPVAPEGCVVCATCDGLRWVVSDDEKFIIPCRACNGIGYYRPCPHCGKGCSVSTQKCEGHQLEREARQTAEWDDRIARRWRKVPASPWNAAPVPPGCPFAWSDGLERTVDEDELAEAWQEKCAEDGQTYPEDEDGTFLLPPIPPEWALLYATKPIRFRYSASNVQEQLYGEFGGEDWSPTDSVGEAGWAALQTALDEWCAAHVDGIGWEPDYSRPLLPPGVEP